MHFGSARHRVCVDKTTMSEKIIELGIIFLLIYTPLAIGGGSEFSVVLLEMVSGILLVVWFAKVVAQRHRVFRRHRVKERLMRRDRQDRYSIRLAISPLFVPICIFGVLILLQLIPVPGFLVKILSPHTYHLYAEWASYTASAIPGLLPLSVYSHATEGELYKFLAYAALFLVIMNTIRSQKQMKRLVYTIIAVGFLESFYSFAQFSGYSLPYFNIGQRSSLAYGTFVNRNHLAGYLEMVIPLAFGVLFVCLGKSGPSPLKKFMALFEEKYLKALLVLFIIFILIGALFLTGSRGGILSFSLSMLFLCLLAYTRRLLRKWVLVVLIFLLLVLGSVVIASPEIVIRRLSALTKPETEQSFRYRWEVWKDSVLICRDFPLFGSGFGTFSHIFQRYQRFPSDVFFAYTENDYLQQLVETGVVGIFLILWIGVVFFVRTLTAWKQRHSRWTIAMIAGGLSAVFSLCIHSTVDFNLHVPSNAILFTVVAALSYVAAHTHKKSGR
jgi:O-antigen ligase